MYLLSKNNLFLWPWVAVGISFLLLFALAIQYPLTTTFPIGGDAARYVQSVQKFLDFNTFPRNIGSIFLSWYPLANLSFAPFALLPLEWPIRFTWWASTGQIAVGISLGYFLYQCRGRWAAVGGIMAWGLTPVIATRHYEDGTIAQLWSYIFVFLFLESVRRKKAWWSLSLIIITFLTHPITGLAVFLSSCCAIAGMHFLSHTLDEPSIGYFKSVRLGIIALLLMGGVLLWFRLGIFEIDLSSGITIRPNDIVHSAYAPILFIAAPGLFYLLHRLRKNPLLLVHVMSLIAVISFLALNYVFGFKVWSDRLFPLLFIAISLLVGFGWAEIMSLLFSSSRTKTAVTLLFCVLIGINVWNENSPTYKRYESASIYLRINKNELAGIDWMKNNLPPTSKIYTSNVTRHAEWIPVLSLLNWQALTTDLVPGLVNMQSGNVLKEQEYAVYFLRTESPPDPKLLDNNFAVVFKNKDIMIITRAEPK